MAERNPADSSVIKRGNRFNITKNRVEKLVVFGFDQGTAPVEAIRMGMLKYQPAIDQLKKNLDLNYPHKKQKIREMGNKVLTRGQIDHPDDIPLLLDLLDSILGVFQELGQSEVEMRRSMVRNADDFLPNGRVLEGLERALEDIASYLDDDGGESSEDEDTRPREQDLQQKRKLSEKVERQHAKIRARFERDDQDHSSMVRSPVLPQHESPTRAPSSRDQEVVEEEDVIMEPEGDKDDMEEEEAGSNFKGVAQKLPTTMEADAPPSDMQRSAIEAVGRSRPLESTPLNDASSRHRSYSRESVDDGERQVKRGILNLEKFKKVMGGGMNPDEMDSASDDDTPKVRKHRLLRGEEDFLLGPMDPIKRSRYMHGGATPFTAPSAITYKKKYEAAKKAFGDNPAKSSINALKAFNPSERAWSFGPGGLGIQILTKAAADSKDSKVTSPFNSDEYVKWSFATEFSDSQTRYIPWFMIAMKLYQRGTMEQAEYDEGCGETRRDAGTMWAEGNIDNFKDAVVKEIEEDRKQVLYMLETYFISITKHNERKMRGMGRDERGEKGKGE
jgi:hypothetical protein